MSILGIGVRVWCGWCPAGEVSSRAVDGRLQPGVIAGGPFPPGTWKEPDGTLWRSNKQTWNVDLDSGVALMAREDLLTPIDDTDPDAVAVDEREEQTA